jgi:UDP-N-acetylglucosamine:LPS N-acetylglucosamine transferase
MDAGLPTIYVPNENPAQDDQLARANFAARHGAAMIARRDQPELLIQMLETILDPAIRTSMKNAALQLACPNGASEAARLVSQLAQSYRGHRMA